MIGTGDDENAGNSWGQAFKNLQEALEEHAEDGDIIWVAEGTYYPDVGGDGPEPNVNFNTFRLLVGVRIYGGFDGTEITLDDREPGHETILSGDNDEDDDEEEFDDNSYHVVSAEDSEIDIGTILDGFTITAGHSNNRGGGIYLVDSWPLIRGCIIEENTASNGGGGIYAQATSGSGEYDYLEIRNCEIRDNSAGVYGGGVLIYPKYANDHSAVALLNTTIADNVVTSLIVDDSCGGGVHVASGFENASAVTDVVISACTFSNNTASMAGGGLSMKADARLDAQIVSCVFAGNTAVDEGGGLYSYDATTLVINSTFSGNEVTDAAGKGGAWWQEGAFQWYEGTHIANTIFWENDAPSGHEIYISSSDSFLIEYSTVQGGENDIEGEDLTGLSYETSNSNDNPGFQNAGNGNYELAFDSPALDAGSDTLVECDRFDVDENGDDCSSPSQNTPDRDLAERIVDGDTNGEAEVDRGAYEYTGCPGDATGDGVVDTADILEVLVDWGTCGETCNGDLNNDDVVDFEDMLILLAAWGPCPGVAEAGESIEDFVDCMGLTMQDWDEFEYCMTNGTQAERDNCACWMEHYKTVHCDNACLCSPNCPDDDPWDNH